MVQSRFLGFKFHGGIKFTHDCRFNGCNRFKWLVIRFTVTSPIEPRGRIAVHKQPKEHLKERQQRSNSTGDGQELGKVVESHSCYRSDGWL